MKNHEEFAKSANNALNLSKTANNGEQMMELLQIANFNALMAIYRTLVEGK